jgi:hypothetical protein
MFDRIGVKPFLAGKTTNEIGAPVYIQPLNKFSSSQLGGEELFILPSARTKSGTCCS